MKWILRAFSFCMLWVPLSLFAQGEFLCLTHNQVPLFSETIIKNIADTVPDNDVGAPQIEDMTHEWVIARINEATARCTAVGGTNFRSSAISDDCQLQPNTTNLSCTSTADIACCVNNNHVFPPYAPMFSADCKTLGDDYYSTVNAYEGVQLKGDGFTSSCPTAETAAESDLATKYSTWTAQNCPSNGGGFIASSPIVTVGCYNDYGQKAISTRYVNCCKVRTMPSSWKVTAVDTSGFVLNNMVLTASGTNRWENEDDNFMADCNPLQSGFLLKRYGGKLTFRDIIDAGMPEYTGWWNLEDATTPVQMVDSLTCDGYGQPIQIYVTPQYN